MAAILVSNVDGLSAFATLIMTDSHMTLSWHLHNMGRTLGDIHASPYIWLIKALGVYVFWIWTVQHVYIRMAVIWIVLCD